MNATFREKSAWGSLIGLCLVSYWYFPKAFGVAGGSGNAADLIAISVGCVISLVIIEAIYHAVIAVEGRTESDERDALISLKAERLAGWVLGFGLFWLVGHIIVGPIFSQEPPITVMTVGVWILFALTFSEFSKLATQIWLYRIGG